MVPGDPGRVSDDVIRHILRRHADWVRMLRLVGADEVRSFLLSVVESPSEAYRDVVRDDVRYFLRKLDDLGCASS